MLALTNESELSVSGLFWTVSTASVVSKLIRLGEEERDRWWFIEGVLGLEVVTCRLGVGDLDLFLSALLGVSLRGVGDLLLLRPLSCLAGDNLRLSAGEWLISLSTEERAAGVSVLRGVGERLLIPVSLSTDERPVTDRLAFSLAAGE